MSYNWKYCSFYPNNFDASALPYPLVATAGWALGLLCVLA